MPGPGDKKTDDFEEIEEQLEADESLTDGTEEVEEEDLAELDFEPEEDASPQTFEEYEEEEDDDTESDSDFEDLAADDEPININDLSVDETVGEGGDFE